MSVITLLDLQKMNGNDRAVGLIDGVRKATPEVDVVGARGIKGTEYSTLVMTSLPTAQFRNANEGVTSSKMGLEKRLVQTYIMDLLVKVDKAIADRHEDGAEVLLAQQAAAQLKAGLVHVGSQFYYGVGDGGDAKGFPGLIAGHDTTNMVVDATGTTPATGSSVWAIKYGPQDVQFVWGGDGMLRVSDAFEHLVSDDDGKQYMAYCQTLLAYPGLQIGSTKAVGRIKNLTAQNGKTLTDDMIADLISKFPVGGKPDALFMSRRSLKQLRDSRTATNATGAPAPFPTESFGVPIYPTDQILDTEAIA